MMITSYQNALERKLKGDAELRVSAYLQFQDHERTASNEMAAAITAQAAFWAELMTDRPDMQRLMVLGMVRSLMIFVPYSGLNSAVDYLRT